HHAAMAHDRAGAIPAAVKKQEHLRRIAARRQRPFGRNAVGIGRLQPDVGGDWRRRTDGIEPLASLGEAGGPGPGAQQLANGIDLAMGHVQILRLPGFPLWSRSPKTDGARQAARQCRDGFRAGAAALASGTSSARSIRRISRSSSSDGLVRRSLSYIRRSCWAMANRVSVPKRTTLCLVSSLSGRDISDRPTSERLTKPLPKTTNAGTAQRFRFVPCAPGLARGLDPL